MRECSLILPRRRDVLAGSLAGVGSISLLGSSRVHAQQGQADAASPKRALRIAHMTDVHLQPERAADQGFAKALQHVQNLEDPPELIINGGDSIGCSFNTDERRAKVQWDLWHAVLKSECSLPMLHCIGNHDIWGWDKAASGTTGDEPRWGKQWAIEAFEISNRYYSTDRGGWHFIMLDSTQPRGNDYTAHLDEEQWDWLEKDLAATNPQTPVVITTHIPIMTVTSFYDGDGKRFDDQSHNWTVPGSWMHTDAVRLRDLFRQHRNVKLCLSGHMHQVDHIVFDQVGYCCSGAVSGSWWGGEYHGFDAGYAIIDLHTDGSYNFQYVTYNWQPR